MFRSATYQLAITIDENGGGSFVVMSRHQKLAVATVDVGTDLITVHRIRIFSRVGAKRLARILFEEVVGYARAHALKVVTIAGYARNQFSKHPQHYADLWEKN